MDGEKVAVGLQCPHSTIKFPPIVDYTLPHQKPKKFPGKNDEEEEMETDEEKLKLREEMAGGWGWAYRNGDSEGVE